VPQDVPDRSLSALARFSATLIMGRSIFFSEFYLEQWLPLLRVRRMASTWEGSHHNPRRFLNTTLPPPSVLSRPAAGSSCALHEVWQYRELLYFFVWRDVKVRYK
jgi:hypothetical protein